MKNKNSLLTLFFFLTLSCRSVHHPQSNGESGTECRTFLRKRARIEERSVEKIQVNFPLEQLTMSFLSSSSLVLLLLLLFQAIKYDIHSKTAMDPIHS